ncbi:hypothetical protein [Streptomyces sp. NBC_01431]|uniref:hypothetical protein n=1 Tax=Streptomyces sp. NBC_01431 TaxID=2903863 RepID=UPI002E3183F8|nr:hypothetical protein [Streptomyces sp. NBC_01431]
MQYPALSAAAPGRPKGDTDARSAPEDPPATRIAALAALDTSPPGTRSLSAPPTRPVLLLEKIQDTHVAIISVVGSTRTVTAERSSGEAFGPPSAARRRREKGAET